MNKTFQDSATWQEIHAQPEIWLQWVKTFQPQLQDIRDWVRKRDAKEIIFSGAGTSAYIGETVVRATRQGVAPAMRAVPTTDIVGDPESLLKGGHHKLVVQFGRSGNSSETVGALDILDEHLPDADRLNITCNADSQLANRPTASGEQRVVVLPPETHDTGFAMTSSFTTMLLTALMVFDDDISWTQNIAQVSAQAKDLINEIAARDELLAERAVFLGSGALEPIARESALKVLELTAGKTMTSWDSTLGFRHGPKAAVQEKTTVYVMVRGDHHTSQYDIDIAKEIRAQFPQASVVTIGEGQDISFQPTGHIGTDAMLQVLNAQIVGVIMSSRLGLNIDDPFKDHQSLTRVVTGVSIYPFDRQLYGVNDANA